MKIAIIKQLNEKIPYWFKRPFARIIRRKLIANPIFVKQYEKLVKADTMSEEELQSEQFRLLQQTLWHAYNHTIYYRKLFDKFSIKPADVHSIEELAQLPLLTKKDLGEHFRELQADDVSDSYEVSTGGTTGKPTRVMMGRDAIWREWAFIYHYWSKYGYDFRKSKLVTLRGVSMGKRLMEINPLYQEIRLNLFRMNRDNIHKYVLAAQKYGADFLYGYPSAVYNFCRLAREKEIDLIGKFKAVFLISENLYPFQEEEIIKTLRCHIAIFYGQSERAVFAERYDNGYIFHPFYGVTEISENSTPIVTGFINGKMPLIRYEVDDQVERLQDDYEYRIIGHRDSGYLEGKNGERISAAAINFHDSTFDAVEGYQFIQVEPGYCVLNVLLSENEQDNIILKRIKANVNDKLGSAIQCEVCSVQTLQLTARGKYQMIIQNRNQS